MYRGMPEPAPDSVSSLGLLKKDVVLRLAIKWWVQIDHIYSAVLEFLQHVQIVAEIELVHRTTLPRGDLRMAFRCRGVNKPGAQLL